MAAVNAASTRLTEDTDFPDVDRAHVGARFREPAWGERRLSLRAPDRERAGRGAATAVQGRNPRQDSMAAAEKKVVPFPVPKPRGREELEFLPAALEIVETPPSPIGRAIGATIITLFVVAF